jgi:hypothetical protein
MYGFTEEAIVSNEGQAPLEGVLQIVARQRAAATTVERRQIR